MTQHDMDTDHYAELSMQWYGWGSPIGLGIGLVLIGGFITLLAAAWSLVVLANPMGARHHAVPGPGCWRRWFGTVPRNVTEEAIG